MLLASNGGSSQKEYVDSLFSAYTYTGNGGVQTINNGIDLAGKGGMVWTKTRNAAGGLSFNYLFDTARGATNFLSSNNTNAASTLASYGVTGFNSNGFAVGDDATGTYSVNGPYNYASWTFRRSPKFFDVVTYTGDGVAGRQIPHALGVAPGMVIVKKTSAADGWFVYHRSLGATQLINLNTTDASGANSQVWNNTEPTSSVFTLGTNSGVNQNATTYVAYLFAHDTSTD